MSETEVLTSTEPQPEDEPKRPSPYLEDDIASGASEVIVGGDSKNPPPPAGRD